MTRLATTATTTILAAAIVLATAGVAGACPNCKGTIENTAATAATAAGPSAQPALPAAFNTSIYYMLGGLFAVLGTGGYLVARTIRQTDRAVARRGFQVIQPNAK